MLRGLYIKMTFPVYPWRRGICEKHGCQGQEFFVFVLESLPRRKPAAA